MTRLAALIEVANLDDFIFLSFFFPFVSSIHPVLLLPFPGGSSEQKDSQSRFPFDIRMLIGVHSTV